MKILGATLSLSVWLLAYSAISSFATPEMDLPQTRVSLTYPEFRQLFDAARTAPPPSEIEPTYAFVSAAYEIDWAADRNLVVARWMVENFTATRRLVPVAPEGLALVAAEENSAVFLVDSGRLAVLTAVLGQQAAHVRFASRVTEQVDGQWSVRFPILAAATNLLVIKNVPPEARVVVRGTDELPAVDGRRQFAFPAGTQEVHLTVESKRPNIPSQWEWRSEVVVTPGDAGLRFHARLMAVLLSGDGREMKISMPEGVRGIRPVSGALASWKVEANADNPSVLVMQWNDDAPAERSVELQYDFPVLIGAESWPMSAPAPTLPGSSNVFAVLHSPSMEISGDGVLDKTTGVPLSDWMRERVRGRDFTWFQSKTLSDVAVKWLPVVEPANLIVRSATFHSRIVSDGSQLTEATVELECEGAPRWEFRLPASAKLLRCSLNGSAVRPIQRDGGLEVPLQGASGGKATVTFSYTDSLGRLDPVGGGLTVALPVTGVFMHSLVWSLEIPDSYDVAGIESNARVLPSKQKGRLEMTQELVHGTPTLAEIFYRKRGLEQ